MFSFRWSWTANTVDLSSAPETFSPITVPLHSAGLIPINEISRNERFCNSVSAAPLITVSVLPFSEDPLHRRRGQADVKGHTVTQSVGWIQKCPLGQQERLRRIPKHKPRNTHKQAQAWQLRELFSVWLLALWQLRRGGGYVRLGCAFLFCFTLCSVNSCSWGWKQGTRVCMCANCSLLLQRTALIHQRCSSVTFYHFWFNFSYNWTLKLSAPRVMTCQHVMM